VYHLIVVNSISRNTNAGEDGIQLKVHGNTEADQAIKADLLRVLQKKTWTTLC
jgi:hypothetical protein